MPMKTHIILASSSPRRLEILRALALPVTVIPPRHDERQIIPNETAEDYAVNLAVEKVTQITNQFPDSAGSVIVGADTVVELDGKIYGKPATSLEGVEMLRSLRGRTHRVVTGVAVTGSSPINFLTSFRETYVLMRQYADEEIEEYVTSGEPMDKAVDALVGKVEGGVPGSAPTTGSVPSAKSELHEFTDSTGQFKITARFITYKAGNAHLEKVDGQELIVSMQKLSKADQKYIRDLLKSRK